MRTIENCRSCGSKELKQLLDLGEQRTSDFRENTSKTPAYPIVGVICKDCMLVQLKHTTPSADMYHENYGFKSNVSNSIKDDLKDIVFHTLSLKDNPKTWLDIASNDGTLLSYTPENTFRVGVDPIKFLCEEAKKHANLIINDFFPVDNMPVLEFDVITSISCFYDMDDPNAFVAGVRDVLAEDGIWTIQQNYLLPTMELGAIDNFCHEHLEYYTLLSLEPLLERHGLEVIDVSTSMVNGGSIRTVVAHRDSFPVQDSVEKQRTTEKDAKLDTLAPYMEFSKSAIRNITDLRKLVKELVKEGKTVAILAASTRGSTIWQAADLGPELIKYAVERNPAKVGKHFSAVGIPIVSEEQFRDDLPDYAIIGPWFFAFPEIVEREKNYVMSGGHLIVPLPKLQVIGKDYYETTP